MNRIGRLVALTICSISLAAALASPVSRAEMHSISSATGIAVQASSWEPTDMTSVITAAEQVFGTRYGGMWFSQQGAQRALMIAAVTPSAEEVEAVTRAVGIPGPHLNIMAVSHSQGELQTIRSSVESFIGRHHPKGNVALHVRSDWNQVVVELGPSDAELAELLGALSPADALAIVDNNTVASTMDSRTTYPPYKAGLQILDNSAPYAGYCTSAFTVIINSGPTAGLNQGTTAGHCAYNNDVMGAGIGSAQPVGVANSNSYQAAVGVSFGDHSLIGFANQLDATNGLYVSPTVTKAVVGRMANSEIILGYELCKSGRTTENTCGAVNREYPVTMYNVQGRDLYTNKPVYKDHYSLACSTTYSQGGDSGAPVYQDTGNAPQTARAAGIVSLGVSEGLLGDFLYMCFDPIQHVEEVSGTHVRTF